MYFAHIALAIACYFVIVKGDDEEATNQENPGGSVNSDSNNDVTFVVLIDILYTDNSKRICTGTIIHDNVVITAAHCFTGTEPQSFLRPELTASFVVIGTKAMFETGYEQYLPIERVIIHPKFNAWTADLCLIYTFAAMTSDKPGTIVPVAGENIDVHEDSNVTILSWGRSIHASKISSWEDQTNQPGKNSHKKEINCDDDWNTSCDLTPETYSQEKVTKYYHNQYKHINKRPEPRSRDSTNTIKKLKKGVSRIRNKLTSRINSRYLTTGVKTEPKYEQFRDYESEKHSIFEKENPKAVDYKSYFKNWRRNVGTQVNQLTVENFSIVNFQSCKSFIDRSMRSEFDISKTNDVICYQSDDRFITDNDAGAPAMRNGKLVAVTVGDVESDGDHVTIGMKMSCYCSWIADNLPNDAGKNFSCCKSCCDVKHKEIVKKQIRKNKSL